MDDTKIEKALKQLDRVDDIIAKLRDILEASLDEYDNDSEDEFDDSDDDEFEDSDEDEDTEE